MTFDFTINVGEPQPEWFPVPEGMKSGKPLIGHIPNFGRLYTHRSVRDGRWSDPGTWDRGEVPRGGAVVIIDHEVEYDMGPWPPEGIEFTAGSEHQIELR